MSILSICGCAVIACMLIVLIKQYKPELSVAAGIAAGCVLLVALISRLLPVIQQMNAAIGSAGLAGEDMFVLVKAMGIALAAQLTSDICKDAGQQALASKVDFAGRLAILTVALPLLTDVLNTALGLIK